MHICHPNRSRSQLLACLLVLAASSARGVELTRGPFLQTVGPRSALVVWLTSEAADSVVEHATVPDPGALLRTEDPTPVSDHAVLLTGLEPGREYTYRVSSGGQALGDFHPMKTAPDPDGAPVPFRFIAFGDTGGGTQSQLDVAAQVALSKPAFGIHIGDLVYTGPPAQNMDLVYFSVYAGTLVSSPIYTAMGNKEYEFDDGAAYLQAFHLPEDGADPERYYSFVHGNALFIALDSNRDVAAGGAQARWLDERLEASDSFWKVVFFHHPAFSSGQTDTSIRAVLAPILQKHGVDLVIQGHTHFYERTYPMKDGAATGMAAEPSYVDPEGPVYLVTGGGGGRLATASPKAFSAKYASVYHHVRVDVDDNVLRLAAVDDTGAVIDEATITKTKAPVKPVFHRGDADQNGELQLTDAIRTLGFLFLGTEVPGCLEAADADDNGEVQLTDAIRTLSFLFTGGPPPAAPGPPPAECGPDPDGSVDVGCVEYHACP